MAHEDHKMERRKRTWREVAQDWRLILTTVTAGAIVLAGLWALLKPISVQAIGLSVLATKGEVRAIREEYKAGDAAVLLEMDSRFKYHTTLEQEQFKVLNAELRKEISDEMRMMTRQLVEVIKRQN